MFDLSIAAQIEAARPHFKQPVETVVRKGFSTPGRLHRDLILAFLPKTNGVSSREIEEKFNISKTCACQNLQELRRDGLAKQNGKVSGVIQWVRV